jgi:AcrR family transcriptional regulator
VKSTRAAKPRNSDPSTAAERVQARSAGTERKRDQDVVDAAVRVFHAKGYASATVQDVANELGILKGSLYHYIDTKEDLLRRVLEQVHADVDKILGEVRALPDLAPLERLREYVRRQVLFNLNNIMAVSVYYHDVEMLSEEPLREILAWRRVHSRFIAGLITQAQADGDVDPDLDARVITNCVFGTVIWTYRWYQPNGRWGREMIADHCAAYVLGGVVVDLATPPA